MEFVTLGYLGRYLVIFFLVALFLDVFFLVLHSYNSMILLRDSGRFSLHAAHPSYIANIP
jgi:hypothetical protein